MIAGLALSFASCQKELDNAATTGPGDVVVLTLNATHEVGTKTVLEGTSPKWTAGDKVTVMYKKTDEDTWTSAESGAASSADSYVTATFSTSLTSPDESKDAYAIYPANNLSQDVADKAKITIASTQHPTGTSFDGGSDILISKPFNPTTSPVTTQFARLGAVLKINLINSDLSNEKILNLSLEGASPLAGDVLVGLSDKEVKGIENGTNTVTAEYLSGQFTIGSGNYIYLIVKPQTLASGSELTIHGETENTTFSKTITLEENINLNSGHIIPFHITIASYTLKDRAFLEERFAGSGGTMASPSGDITYDETGWTSTGTANGASNAAKYGSASAVGNVTTPSITIPKVFEGQTIKLSFRAVAWKDDRTSLNLSATNATLSESSVTMNNDSDHTFKTFDLTLTVNDIDSPISINFLGESNSSKPKVGRFYLDDVLVYYGTKPTEKTSPSLSFGVSSATAVIGDSFTEPTFNNPNTVSPIAWISDDEDVAIVDGSGNVTAIAAGSTTIKASFAGNSTYRAQTVSYELTVEAASLAASATSPSKAAASENSTVSFTVTSNIGWTATKGTDNDNIIKSVSSVDNTVTVTFNENTGSEKSATVNVTPTNATFSALSTNVTVTQSAAGSSYTVTYTVTSKTAVSTTGTAPAGSSATYSQTYSTAKQMTSGNSITLTLSNYTGKKIIAATLSMHSNKSTGAGGMTFKSGTRTIASVANSTDFNNSAWYGSWSQSYVDVVLDVTETTVASAENVVLNINASANSLFFEAITITYQ